MNRALEHMTEALSWRPQQSVAGCVGASLRCLAEQVRDADAESLGDGIQPRPPWRRPALLPMRNRGLVDATEGGQPALTQAGVDPKAGDVPVDRPEPDSGSSLLSHALLGDIFSTGSQALEEKSLPQKVISGAYMGGAKHPRRYVEGPRKQMTRAWKELVLTKLEENERGNRTPRSIPELARMLGADKRGIYVTFDLDRDPQQMSSSYVDSICEILKIGPPLVEGDEDSELQADLDIIRSLLPDARRELMVVARRMPKKTR